MNNYFNKQAVSQSLLKAVNNGIGEYKRYLSPKDNDEEREVFTLGRIVDEMLSGDFEDHKKILTADEKPQLKNIIDYVITQENYLPLEILINAAITKFDVKKGNIESITQRVLDSEYYKQKKEGKYIKEDIYNTALQVYTSIVTHPHTNWYLQHECHYQVPIYWVENGYECKALIDCIAIDRVNKVIYIIDFKTTGFTTLNFPNELERLNYWFQAIWYREHAFKHIILDNVEGYTVAPFHFIVESTKWQGCPLTYIIENIPLEKYQQLDKAFEDHIWHQENNLFMYSREVYESNGKIVI